MMRYYSTKIKKMHKEIWIFVIWKNNDGEKLFDTATKTGRDTTKTTSKKRSIKQVTQQVDL